MFNKIDIKNFRGIKNLSIDSIKRINLLIGQNNCGKSSVLEAIFLNQALNNTQIVPTITNIRGSNINEVEDLSNIFYEKNFKNNINITSYTTDAKKRVLEIVPNQKIHNDIALDFKTNINSFSSLKGIDELSGIIYNYEIFKETSQQEILNLSNSKEFIKEYKEEFNGIATLSFVDFNFNNQTIKQLQFTPISDSTFIIKGAFLSSRINNIHIHVIETLNNLLITKQEEEVKKQIKEIFPEFIDYSFGKNNTLLIDTGLEKLIPIQFSGDGLIKTLNILLNIIHCKNGILLIDELENGLYFSSLKNIWKLIFKNALKYNVQLFITTHSSEILKFLKDFQNENKENIENQNELQIFNILKIKNEHNVYKYDNEDLNYAISHNMEIRN